MAMSRSLGGRPLTTRSPITISPAVMCSSPASIRRSVDLPQPDGPTSTTNCPSSMSTVTPCSTSVEPNALRTSRNRTSAISLPPGSLSREPLVSLWAPRARDATRIDAVAAPQRAGAPPISSSR